MNSLIIFLLFSGLGSFILLFSKEKCNWQKALGESFFIGVFIVVSINNIAQLLDQELSQSLLFNTCSTLALLFISLNAFTKRKKISRISISIKPLFFLFLIIIAIHFYYYLSLNQNLPLTSWDAWNGWVAKAKIWYFQGINQNIVHPTKWLLQENNYANTIAHYPDGLSLLYVFNAGFFGWQETALNAIYPAAFFAFLLAFYGNLKQYTNANYAIIATAVFASLPFVASHVVLAGYADFWIASYLFLCIANIYCYTYSPNSITRIKILIFALSMLAFKLIAWVWLIILFFSFVIVKLSIRKRKWFYISFLIICVIWYFLGGFRFQTAFGLLAIEPNLIQIPGLGSYKLIFLNTSKAWLEALFYSYNWHILWFSLPFVLYIVSISKNKKPYNLSAIFLSFSTIFLFVLFYMTYNSVFANDFTSSNRIVLHIVPIYLLFLSQVFYTYRNPDIEHNINSAE